ncbi:MAG: hydroxymethylglutaryl-CoA lyase [Terracidiphilus sp.]|jgi:hydroxymethylglutaryl-CoA lyase
MGDLVKIVECPRDAWQGLPTQMPAEVKADYLRKLVAAGFTHIDAVSFVSPAAIPQMADSEKVLQLLDPPDDVEIIGIVVNVKGAERAINARAVETLGFPFSISPQFLARNQHQTPAESLHVLEAIGTLAHKAGLDVVAYVSMAFGNPYEDAWSIDEVADACDLLIELGVRQISLADTVGLATPARIAETLAQVLAAHDGIEVGVHLHARPHEASAKIRAAFEAGCRRFDAAIGGLGGCPFAQDALVENIPTETLIAELKELGAQTPKLQPLNELIHLSAEIARSFGAAGQRPAFIR